MPQITIQGVPTTTSFETLRKLRADLIEVVERAMGIKQGITRVFFPNDLVGDPDPGQDNLIWGFLYTGMFTSGETKSIDVTSAQATTAAIAATIKAAFKGTIGVEVFIIDLDAETKTLLKPD